MMKFNFPETTVPPDQYRAVMPDGTLIKQGVRREWYAKIKAHYEMNSYVLPEDWKEQYEDKLCRLLPPGWCLNGNGVHVETRLTAGQIYHGAVTLSNIVAQGPDALVPIELAEKRAAVCSSCPANVNVSGCLPCLKVSDLIMSVTGPKRSTPSDHLLKSCACCGCPCQSAVHIKIEILSKARSADMNARFGLMSEWCWQQQERMAAGL